MTEVSLLCLPFLLVPVAHRGVKKARLSRKKAVDMFFQDMSVCLSYVLTFFQLLVQQINFVI